MKLFLTASTLLFPLAAFAAVKESVTFHPAMGLFAEKQSEIKTVLVDVRAPADADGNKARWNLNETEKEVLLGQLLYNTEERHPDDAIFAEARGDLAAYKGITLTMNLFGDGDKSGGTLGPLTVFNGRISDNKGKLLRRDPGRRLELWLFGTAKRRKDMLLAIQAIPVFTFDQCRLLGNMIVASTPRQCLLPDGNLLLDVPETATVASMRIKNFDDCLEQGQALIDTFPRRCVAQGGRVFTEPPRIDLGDISNTMPHKKANMDDFLQEFRAGKFADPSATAASGISATFQEPAALPEGVEGTMPAVQ
ncbi:MAG: hypothetical protein WAX89_06415 [Alphaproteobacteria bacterium]